MTKVLITGMSGLIGGLLKEHLSGLGGYELSALNRSEVEGVQNFRALPLSRGSLMTWFSQISECPVYQARMLLGP